jgi:hypothetical protein
VSDPELPGDEIPDTEPTPIRRVLDMFVFAPVGVALTMAEDLPGLASKGRDRVETEIRNARVVGEFVVTAGQQELGRRLGDLFHGGSTPEADPVDNPTDNPGATPTDPGAAPTAAATPAPSPAPEPVPAATKPAPDPADGPLVEAALAGYDTLSASQVVRRLESLGPDELRAVHRHEASHRNRRTILNRTTQLLEGG